MSRVLIPSSGPENWKQFLAQPELHWSTGFSARTLAHCWEESKGVPPEVSTIIEQAVGPISPLVVIPEHKTPLPGGQRESQSDVFLLGRHCGGTIACTIEGKVDEAFGPMVAEQMVGATSGKIERLRYLCDQLGLDECPGAVRYQLLHRTVSALIEAERFDATHAAMIVHSFSPTRRWFDDFAAFVELLGGEAEMGRAFRVEGLAKPLVLGWACGDQQFRER